MQISPSPIVRTLLVCLVTDKSIEAESDVTIKSVQNRGYIFPSRENQLNLSGKKWHENVSNLYGQERRNY